MTGPPAIDPERLLAETRWLRGLARQLVGDGDAADDVVQETWLAALRRPPPTAGDRGGLRGWLAQVARNAARMRRRGEARRREREQLVAARRAAGRDDDREPLQAQQRLLAAVMALEPEDRRVVTMRFLDELPPREIARRLGTTSSAVRSRLSRALGVLRARLAPDGDHGALLLLLSPLLPGGAAATSTSLWFGMLLMKGKMLAGIAAAALLAVGLWIWSPAPAGAVDAGPGGRTTVAGAAVAADPARVAIVTEQAAATGRVPAGTSTAPPPAAQGAVEGRLVVTARCVDERRQPLPGAKVSSTFRGRPFALADADGRVRLEMAWPPERAPGGGGWVLVEASVDGRVTLLRERDVSPRGGEVALGDFVLAPAGGLTGLVRDVRGGPAANVRVWVAQGVTPLGGEAEQLRRAFGGQHFRRLADEVQAVVTTDEHGRYRFDALPCLEASVIVEPERALCSYSAPVQIVAGQVIELPPIVIAEPSADGRIAGVVLDAAGDGIAGMAVQLMANRSGRNGSALAQQRTGGDGAFEFVVPPGWQFTVVAMGTGRDGRRRAVHDVASGTTGLRIEFAAPRALQLSVTGPEGEVVQPSSVTGLSADGFGMLLATRPGADGAGERLLPDETFSLMVSAKGYRSRTVGPFDPANVDLIEVQLEKAAVVTGRVTAAGEPVAGARVHLHRLDERQQVHRFCHGVFTRLTAASPAAVTSDADGNFELSVQRDGSFVLHAEADGFARGSSAEFEVRDGVAAGAVVIALPRPAGVSVQVMVGEGESVEALLIAATTGDGHVEVATTDAEGRVRFDGLAPGGWQLRACPAADERSLREARTLPERRVTMLPVDLVLSEGVDASFLLDLRGRSAAELVGEFAVEGLVTQQARVSIWRDGTYLQQPLGADGRFTVRTAVGPNKLFAFVELPGGARLELNRRLDLQAGRNEVSLRLPGGGVEVRGLTATPVNLQGERVLGYALVWTGLEGTECVCRFEPTADGTWRFGHLPAGAFELRRRGEAGDAVAQWEVLSRGEIAAGQWRTLDLR